MCLLSCCWKTVIAADVSEGFIELNALYQWQTIFDTDQVNHAFINRQSILLQSNKKLGTDLNIGIGITPMWALTMRWGVHHGIKTYQTLTYECSQQHCHQVGVRWIDQQYNMLLGIRYQPYDEYSPLISVESGVSYAYSNDVQEVLFNSSDQSMYQGRSMSFTEEWSWLNRIGVAFLWRWHTDYSVAMGTFVNYNPTSPYSMSYGIQMWVSVYRYLQWI